MWWEEPIRWFKIQRVGRRNVGGYCSHVQSSKGSNCISMRSGRVWCKWCPSYLTRWSKGGGGILFFILVLLPATTQKNNNVRKDTSCQSHWPNYECLMAEISASYSQPMPVGEVFELLLLIDPHWTKHRLTHTYKFLWVGPMLARLPVLSHISI